MATSSAVAAPVAPGPRVNSTCLQVPTVVQFQPPAFGSDFNGSEPTPAQLQQAASPAMPSPVTMQYSIHKVPVTMKLEMRAIFPELSSRAFAAAAYGTPSPEPSASSAATSAAAASSTAAASSIASSVSSSTPLTSSEFRTLPLLAIPTFQKAPLQLVNVTPEVEREKNRLLESFYAWAKRVCHRLRGVGTWADLVDPCTGYPTIGVHGNGVYSEVDSAAILLAYRMEQVGQCSMIDHPQWNLAHYPATMLTTATMEQTQQAIAAVQEELACRS